MILLHYTGMQTEEAALEKLCDPTAQVSSHYFVSETGEVFQLVEDDKRAWHAGVSYWDGETDINSASIGIEIANPGHEFGYRAFPDEQITAVIRLCRELIARHNIRPDMILGHSDTAPERKEDPGELFPWERLAANGVGLWPAVTDGDNAAAEELVKDQKAYQLRLKEYGYNSEAPFPALLTAFHRHFCPEIFNSGGDPGKPAKAGAARLLALLRAKRFS